MTSGANRKSRRHRGFTILEMTIAMGLLAFSAALGLALMMRVEAAAAVDRRGDTALTVAANHLERLVAEGANPPLGESPALPLPPELTEELPTGGIRVTVEPTDLPSLRRVRVSVHWRDRESAPPRVVSLVGWVRAGGGS
jgi:prepilin-type N-terminal cleavage/methylation domain-containing protein